jgi:hypothetical protein
MKNDPKARLVTLGFEGGTVRLSQGLYDALFGAAEPTWGGGTTATTQSGRRRYKYGTRQRTSAAAGKQIMLDLKNGETYSVRVTGVVVQFIDSIVSKSGDKIARIYTRRGQEYAPTLGNI